MRKLTQVTVGILALASSLSLGDEMSVSKDASVEKALSLRTPVSLTVGNMAGVNKIYQSKHRIEITARTESDESIPVAFEMKEDSLEIFVRYPKRGDNIPVRLQDGKTGLFFGYDAGLDSGETLPVDLSIGIPRGMLKDLTVSSLSGAIEVDYPGVDELGEKRKVEIHSMMAKIAIRKIQAGGEFKVRSVSDITIEETLGDLEVSGMEGDVVLRKGRGNIKVETGSGSISLDSHTAFSIDCESENGDIRLANNSVSRENIKSENGRVIHLRGN